MTTETINPPATKDEAYQAFQKWINQRPGLDPRDYFSDWRDTVGRSAYNSDARMITKQRTRALAALMDFDLLSYDPAVMAEACRSAYSGRLTFNANGELTYVAGQYWATEYRQAAAIVLESYNSAIRATSAQNDNHLYTYSTIADVKSVNKSVGGHFFGAGTMRYFNSRVETELYRGRYFITSEKHDNDPRLYTIRQALPTGEVETVGDFQQYHSIEAARAAMHLLDK